MALTSSLINSLKFASSPVGAGTGAGAGVGASSGIQPALAGTSVMISIMPTRIDNILFIDSHSFQLCISTCNNYNDKCLKKLGQSVSNGGLTKGNKYLLYIKEA